MPGQQQYKTFDLKQSDISSIYQNHHQISHKKYSHHVASRAFSVETTGTTELPKYSSIITDSNISPVLPVGTQTYKHLDMCDCSLLPDCALGDCIPLNTFEDDFIENDWKQQKYNQIDQKHIIEPQKRIKVKSENSTKIHRLRPQHIFGSNLSSPGPSSSTQSPLQGHSSPLSATSEGSTESAPASFLFRLPLTISRVRHGIADCEVRASSSCGSINRKYQSKAMPIDFTEMGVFIAPHSDTDPDEAFVVVERRRLFVKSKN